jgi:hypothetical protein
MLPEDKELTVEEYFRKYYRGDAYNIDREIQKLLDVVQLKSAPLTKKI